MIRNYFIIAWRSLQKNRTIFVINTLGLAIGIATCLTMTFYVAHELSYDKYHTHASNTYRVILDAKMGEEHINEASIMAPVAGTLKQELPDVKFATRFYKFSDATKASYLNKTLRKGRLLMADANFFEVFDYKFLKGDAKTALQKLNSIVLTEDQAKSYFGNENPINKNIEIKDIGYYDNAGYHDLAGTFTVTGIIANIPSNSHIQFSLLASLIGKPFANNPSWLSGQFYTYLVLKNTTNLEVFKNKLKVVVDKNFGPQIKSAMGLSMAEFLAKGNKVGLQLQPLTDIHLKSNLRGELEQGGNYKNVTMFGAIAFFMLLIACVNFMNLSTASASKRVKEIGIRKVLGSEKTQLIRQFLSESFISTTIAMILGIGIFCLTLPLFNNIANKHFEIASLFTLNYILVIVAMTLLISLLAGLYPAFFMSSFNALQAIKNQLSKSGNIGVRGSLVVFQFAISTTLIIGTLVVNQQMNYIQNKDIGYNRKSLIVIRDAGFLGNKLEIFKNELKIDKRVQNITTSAYVPAGPTDSNMQVVFLKKDPTQRIRIKEYSIDEEYVPTLEMKVLKGRNFTKLQDEKSSNIIINETAVKQIGLPANPIGETIKMGGNGDSNAPILTVVGVVKDFHARSLREPIEPLIMKYNPYYGLIIKAENKEIPSLIKTMENKWNSFGTGEVFGYAFLDELYNETYLTEANANYLLRLFALLTIFVACLGLFGLVTFTTEQRIKEIGVRKVLGSTVSQIVLLLSKDFLKLIGISMLIAFPLGYYAMNNWLQDFEYRIQISWLIFVIAGLATVFIAFVTISFKSIRAALMNPVKSLKTE